MKPIPHDPLDDLLAAAVLGELTADEHAQLAALLEKDAAARAAYQETQHMHDLLEKNYRAAQPDSAFEDRMISGVRRRVEDEKSTTKAHGKACGYSGAPSRSRLECGPRGPLRRFAPSWCWPQLH